MKEKIYIRNAEGKLHPSEEKEFETEDSLQRLIAQHPELLAGDRMRPDDPLRWMLIRREMPIESWAVDLLLMDQHSCPTLVEVKRGDNREGRRAVVGQMLDYASAVAAAWSGDTMRVAFERDAEYRGSDPHEELRALLGNVREVDIEKAADAFWERAATNLEAGRLRLLFVSDKIPFELERSVVFWNMQTKEYVEVLAVEVKQYPGQFGDALVSRVIGQVDAPSSGNARSPNLSPNELLDSFRPDVREVMLPLFDAIENAGGELRYRRTAITVRGRSSQWTGPLYLARFYVTDGGRFEFTFDYNDGLPEELRTLQKEYVGEFSSDEFISAMNRSWGEGWVVNSDNFVEHIDLLTGRLCSTLSELGNL
ncbi:MAG: hypothetical protein OXE87_15490 [Chloroflexi bacterium]|nr:hypothetical protein [Chloroflexota bacterium]